MQVSDGKHTSDTTITVYLKKHTWQFKSKLPDEYCLFVAADSNTIYTVYKDGSYSIWTQKSIDGGLIFQNINSFFNADAIPSHLDYNYPNLYIGGNVYASWFLRIFDINTGNVVYDTTISNNINSFSASENAILISTKAVRTSYSSYSLFLKTAELDTTVINNLLFNDIAFSKNKVYAVSDSGLYSSAIPKKVENLLQWTNLYPLYKFNRIECISNSGDTIFCFNNNGISREIYKFINNSSSVITTQNIKDLKMATGNSGWLLDSDGNVYFTHDSFLNKYNENIYDKLGNPVTVSKIFLSRDKKTLFAVDSTLNLYSY
jgi:hypothetical protein